LQKDGGQFEREKDKLYRRRKRGFLDKILKRKTNFIGHFVRRDGC